MEVITEDGHGALGLNPSVCQSGAFEGSTALKRHGIGPLRALLVHSAKKLLQVDNPLKKWDLAVAARRGRNKAAVAVARKLCVAIWHLLMGHPIGVLEPVHRLTTKLGELATELGLTEIQGQGYKSKTTFIGRRLSLYSLIVDLPTCLHRLVRHLVRPRENSSRGLMLRSR